MEPDIHHHEVFYTTTPDKTSNVGQDLKVSNRVNWIKVSYAQYYKNSTFGLPITLFTHANLPSTTRIIQSVLSPVIKNISDNIYQYCLHHCTNGGTKLKGIESDKYIYLVIEATAFFMIITIYVAYQITIGIEDFTNDTQNTFKAS